jgi:hypothetical protein
MINNFTYSSKSTPHPESGARSSLNSLMRIAVILSVPHPSSPSVFGAIISSNISSTGHI